MKRRQKKLEPVPKTMIYKYPGKFNLHGLMVDKVIIESKDADEYLEQGWSKSPKAAKKLFDEVTAEPVEEVQEEEQDSEPEEIEVEERLEELPELETTDRNQDVTTEFSQEKGKKEEDIGDSNDLFKDLNDQVNDNVELDKEGQPWDPDIHTADKAKTKAGTWRKNPFAFRK